MNYGRDELKDWKLLQGALGFFALAGIAYYVSTGNFKPREWLPLLPASPSPDSLLFQLDAMRTDFQQQRFAQALDKADTVLARDRKNPEAFRVRSVCLVRVGRFKEAEQPLRILIAANKNDLTSRLFLGIALRGQGDNDRARDVLLRLREHPLLSGAQRGVVDKLLAAMDAAGVEASPTPDPSPSPQEATPEPELPSTQVKRPKGFLPPTPAPPWEEKHPTPEPKPSPDAVIGPVLIPTTGIAPVSRSAPPRTILPATADTSTSPKPTKKRKARTKPKPSPEPTPESP